MPRVLVVDDEPSIARTLRINLAARDYEVEAVGDGRSALEAVSAREPDVVVLDLGLPDLDGVEVLRRLRVDHDVPVIVLSARQESDDKVEALDAGADDYVTKPFGMAELLARVRAAVRRGEGLRRRHPLVVESPDLRLDFGRKEALRDRRPVHLTPTEWRLLEVLARAEGGLVEQADLLREAWGPGYGREAHYLRVYANQLRRKLEADPANPRHLLTEPGLGYRLVL